MSARRTFEQQRTSRSEAREGEGREARGTPFRCAFDRPFTRKELRRRALANETRVAPHRFGLSRPLVRRHGGNPTLASSARSRPGPLRECSRCLVPAPQPASQLALSPCARIPAQRTLLLVCRLACLKAGGSGFGPTVQTAPVLLRRHFVPFRISVELTVPWLCGCDKDGPAPGGAIADHAHSFLPAPSFALLLPCVRTWRPCRSS